jgi:predicted dithiol-disulfide oxidoreductase (DUF899 family)
MGWSFTGSPRFTTINYDFHVSFTGGRCPRAFYNFRHTDPGPADLSGDVFFKDKRDDLPHVFDLWTRQKKFLGPTASSTVPKGRDENGPYHSLADWVAEERVRARRHGRGTAVPSCVHRASMIRRSY